MKKIKKLSLLILAVACTTGITVSQVPAVDPLPFEVTIGGQKAEKSEEVSNVAVLKHPVKANAKIELKDIEGQVIINAFPSDAQANPETGAQPMIIMFKDGKGKLSDITGGGKLKSGNHLLNIIGGGKTARILIEVK